MFDKHYIGLGITDSENNGKLRPISRVTLWVDDSNCLTAGDDTGAELEADCPHATQAMVESILAQVKGYQYQMYSASDANLDPAAELGDGATVAGIYSVISRIEDDGSGYSGISAPGEAELEGEFPTDGPMTQEFNRQMASVRSSITKTAEQIELKIEATDGRVSSLTQYVDSLTLSVSNGSTYSSIALKSGDITIASQTIYMDGLVTFTGLSNGTTTIDGACIKTGTIEAERLNLTGAITFTDLSSSVQGDINEAVNMANDAYDLAYDNQLPRYIKSTYISSTEIRSPIISGGEIHGMDFYGNTFNIYPDEDSEEEDPGSFNIYGNAGAAGLYNMFRIRYHWAGSGPIINISSPADAQIRFSGLIDFSSATVTGLD